MSFFSSFFGGKSQDPSAFPWSGLPSLYHFIQSHLDEQGVLQLNGFLLPDDDRVRKESDIHWAPGARDGVMSHHLAAQEDNPVADKVAQAIDAFARNGRDTDKVALYQLLRDLQTLSHLDDTISRLADMSTPLMPHLLPFLRWLIQEGADREPVKAAIAMLGMVGDEESENIITTLGKHDEFTLFTAVAYLNLHENPEDACWQLAQKVSGWGHIHLVERLANTHNPEIQEWMLREGFRNEIMDEYLAYICATTGKLKAALLREEVDEPLLTSAGELISALIRGGPTADINVYEDAAETLTYYVHQLSKRTLDDSQKGVLSLIRSYIDDEEKNWEAREPNGWTEENRFQLRDRIDDLLGQASSS